MQRLKQISLITTSILMVLTLISVLITIFQPTNTHITLSSERNEVAVTTTFPASTCTKTMQARYPFVRFNCEASNNPKTLP